MSTPIPDSWLDDFPVLFGLPLGSPEEQATVEAEADRIYTVLGSSESPLKDKSRGVRFSDGATEHIPLVAKALERARQAGVSHSLGMPFDYYQSNTGRNPLKIHHNYVPTERQIRSATYRDALERGERSKFARDLELYPHAVEAAERGASAVKTVILASPRDAGNREFTVSRGWTQYRLAHKVVRAYKVHDCSWCGVVRCGTAIDMFLLVGTGATMYALGLCFECERRLANDPAVRKGSARVDVIFAWDDWPDSAGWPDQRSW